MFYYVNRSLLKNWPKKKKKLIVLGNKLAIKWLKLISFKFLELKNIYVNGFS